MQDVGRNFRSHYFHCSSGSVSVSEVESNYLKYIFNALIFCWHLWCCRSFFFNLQMTRNEQQLHGNSHIFSPFVFVLFLKENFYSVCEQKLGSIRHLVRREDTSIVTTGCLQTKSWKQFNFAGVRSMCGRSNFCFHLCARCVDWSRFLMILHS